MEGPEARVLPLAADPVADGFVTAVRPTLETGGAAPLCAITVLPNQVVSSKDVPLYTL